MTQNIFLKLLTLICTFHSALTFAQIAGNILLELIYSNPKDFAMDGWCDVFLHDIKCDTYFKICITSSYNNLTSCDIGNIQTKMTVEESYIQLIDDDAIKIRLYSPIPSHVDIRIHAFDHDRISAHDEIAIFYAKEVSLEASDSFKNINLKKYDNGTYNTNVIINGSIKVECAPFLYRKLCDLYCQTDQKTYFCDKDGSKICSEGHHGTDCELIDHCTHNPCKSFASCQNINKNPGFVCLCDKKEYGECYRNWHPCLLQPCQNGGKCQEHELDSNRYRCLCPNNIYGQNCTETLSPCLTELSKIMQKSFGKSSTIQDIEICVNNGTCIDNYENFSFICNCSNEWTGIYCQDKKSMDFLILCAFLIPVILICIFAASLFIIWKKKCYTHISKQGNNYNNLKSNRCTLQMNTATNEMYEILYQHEPIYTYVPNLSPIQTNEMELNSLSPSVKYSSLLWKSNRHSGGVDNRSIYKSNFAPPLPPKYSQTKQM